MKIGIKYCGGCNPAYDRTALFKKVQLLLCRHQLEPVAAGKVYDYIVILSGCLRQCVSLNGLCAEKEIIVLTTPETVEKALSPLLSQ